MQVTVTSGIDYVKYIIYAFGSEGYMVMGLLQREYHTQNVSLTERKNTCKIYIAVPVPSLVLMCKVERMEHLMCHIVVLRLSIVIERR